MSGATIALPPHSNLIDLDGIAADLHREGFSLWLRFDGEEFLAELLCGVSVLPANEPRPRGRAVAAGDAVAAALKDRAEIFKRLKK